MTTPNDVGLDCYLYGIVAADLVVPANLTGVQNQLVSLAPHGDVAALVSLFDSEQPLAGRADLLAHSQVLDAIAAGGPVIPVRFGSIMQDRDTVRSEVLEPGHDRFRAILGDLEGYSQFTVRARYDERQVLTEIIAENPEIAQLRAATRNRPDDSSYGERVRLGELVAHALEAKSAADARALLTELERHAAAAQIHDSAGLDRLLDLALLVDNNWRNEFEQAVEALAESHAGRVRMKLIGPTAPYDFVEEQWA
ncbi:GvpL/GvpF family gas vesicle protein [Kribbella sp. NPDC059898]|uniref:GvpL/GvpF family gas vesicle protein n=1 Tax=Kribbella sp. NPDC059898 TaxID=3346995 RepID=UPI003653350F